MVIEGVEWLEQRHTPGTWGAASARGFSVRNRSRPSNSIILLKAAVRIRSRPPESAQERRKNLLKAAGTLAGKTVAAGARADVESCRPGEPSQQIAEIRTA